MKPFFSIIIPVYNTELYLIECIESVLSQSFTDYEIICVNDGSTDRSLNILKEYENKCQCLRIITQQNQGLSVARNNAMKIAVGEYLLFLDSDDMLAPDALHNIVNAIKKSSRNVDVVAFNATTVSEDVQKIQVDILFNHKDFSIKTGIDYLNEFVEKHKWGPSAVCFYAIRRTLIENANLSFPAGRINEDELFVPIMLTKAKDLVVLPMYCYIYRMRQTSISHVSSLKRYLDMLFVANELERYCINEHLINKYTSRIIFNDIQMCIKGFRHYNIPYKKHIFKIWWRNASAIKEKIQVVLYMLGLK